MTVHPSRRKLIVVILLSLALLGAALRLSFPAGSLSYDIGTLLMVMWVPVVGNIIGYFMKKWRRAPPAPPTFDRAAPFAAHAMAELTLFEPGTNNRIVPGTEYRCALLFGTEAFSARFLVPAAHEPAAGRPHALALEFLVPAAALARSTRDATFRVLDAGAIVGEGRIVQVLAEAPAG